MSAATGGRRSEPLACPSCARTFNLDERFCPDCEMPLVYVGRNEEPVTGTHEKARKVRPEYAGGDLVKVAFARNQAEAELIQGILLEEGIPSLERRMRGFEIPDFMAGGPRDVLVPSAGADFARELLGQFGPPEEDEPTAPEAERLPYGIRLAAGLLVALALASVAIYGVYLLTS